MKRKSDKMKKMTSIALVLAMVFSFVPANVFATGETGSGAQYLSNGVVAATSVAEDFEWEISDEGVLTISGNGAMPADVQSLWDKPFTEVVIEEGITSISDNAFKNCTALVSITVPDGIAIVGDNAFYDCVSLEEIIIPEGVTQIGQDAFYNCSSLTEIIVPDGVAVIGTDAFRGCSGIEKIEIPGSVKSIGCGLSGCAKLKKVILGDGVETIERWAFYDCTSLEEITIPDSVTSIGAYAFSECISLTEITVPGSVSFLNNDTFAGCTGLAKVTLKSGVEYIGVSAFSDCTELDEIIIPDSVTVVAASAFSNTEYYNNATNWEDGVLYIGKILIEANGEIAGEYEIKEGTLSIAADAFSYCTDLTGITIPGSVTHIGSGAFSGCTGLAKTNITDLNAWCEIIFSDNPTRYSKNLYLNDALITELVIPDMITYIQDFGFSDCTSLEKVTIPDSITMIGSYAFSGCTGLKEITIPDSVIVIGYETFSGCSELEKVTILDSVEDIGNDAFSGCELLTIHGVRGSVAEQYAANNGIPFVNIADSAKTISITVKDQAGDEVTSGYTVNWYEKGSDQIIATGKKLTGYDEEKKYEYEVVLGEELSCMYIQPQRQTSAVTEENTELTLTLETIGTVLVKGYVTDAEKKPLVGAEIVFTQSFNNKYQKQITAIAENGGNFCVEIANVATDVRVSAKGYYSKSKSVIEEKTDNSNISLDIFSLAKLPENKISLFLTKTFAVTQEEVFVSTQISDLSNIEFSIFNKTKNKEITEFEVQDMKIILSDSALDGGDTIEITSEDKKGQMTAHKVFVQVDASKNGKADINFIENGKIRLNGVAGNSKNILMLFDDAGKYLKTYDISSFAETETLESGEYTLILMEKTSFFRSFSSVEKLTALGFEENADYIRKEVTVSSGIISEINDIIVPGLDEEKFKYTVDSNTSFVVNGNDIVAGQYVVARLSYEIDPQYTSSNQKITIDFPKEIKFVEESLTFDAENVLHTYGENRLEINTNKSKGVLRFYILPTTDGEFSLNGSLSFNNAGEECLQPLGEVLFDVQSRKINVPPKTGNKKIFVSGKTIAKSNITVYDNDIPVGTTEAKSNGSWSVVVELTDPGKFSVHNIRAEIMTNNGYSLKTPTEEVVYDCYHIEPKTITMYNMGDEGENVTVFDFENHTSPGSYRMYPGVFTKFTFVIDFGKANTEKLKDVSLNVYLNSGEVRNYIADYNEVDDNYIVTADFVNFDEAPINVGVAYANINEEVNYSLITGDVLPETDKEYVHALSTTVEELLECTVTEDNEDISTIECSLGEEALKWDLDIKNLDYSSFDISSLVEQGYTVCKSDNSNEKPQYINLRFTDGKLSYILIDEEYEYAVEFSVPEFDFEGEPEVQAVALFGRKSNAASFANRTSFDKQLKIILAIQELIDNLNYAKEKLSIEQDIKLNTYLLTKRREETVKMLSEVAGLISARCPDGTSKLSAADRAKYINQYNSITSSEATLYDAYEEKIDVYTKTFNNAFIVDALMAGLGSALGKLGKAQIILKNSKNAKYAKYWVRNKEVREYFDKIIEKVIDFTSKKITTPDFLDFSEFKNLSSELCNEYFDLQDAIRALQLNIKLHYQECREEDDESNGSGQTNGNGSKSSQKSTPILDPSGYVYEAVPSNRVEGVKAECYYYDYPIDNFGMPGENKEDIFWIAEEYDQINPLLTDANGMYAWDVPVGEWLVKFSKDGYYDTDSKNDAAANANGYLPVPPPQTEVNTAIVSKATPTVENINVYTNEIQIIFSQYMQIDSVNTSNVKVLCGGQSVTGTISPANAEYDYEKVNEYASIFTFIPDEALVETADVRISDVINYAGEPMVGVSSQTKAVGAKPEGISVSANVDVSYNSGALLEIAISPKKAGANKTLAISTSSPSIVGVVNNTVTTDERGKATVMIDGKLPGEGEIKILLDGTDIETSTRVKVGNVTDTSNSCAKVTASIKSGSAVAKGTNLTLSTATEDAEIYYTLNGTCPCVVDSESRIKYTEPITISEDMFIIAYAVKEGLKDSATAGFVFTVITGNEPVDPPAIHPGNGGGLAAGGDKSNSGADKLGNEDDKKEDADVSPDAPAVSAPEFADLGAHAWAADAIGALAEAGIIKGTSENTFSPAANITRADFAILLVRAFNLTSDNTANFADVSANDYFAAELAVARNSGIVGGIGGNKFAPRNAITRQDMMTIVYRALQNAKVDGIVAPEMTDEVALSKTYTDFTLVSDYAKDAVSVLSHMHFVNGKNGRIAPNEYTTRAEVAVLLQRILEYVK